MLVELIFSAKVAHWREFGIVVMVGGKPMMIPISLPDAKPIAAQPDAAARLGMTLSVKAGELELWSTSGVEGTAPKPIAVATKASAIATALGEVVGRHWPNGAPRPEGATTIIVLGDGGAVPAGRR